MIKKCVEKSLNLWSGLVGAKAELINLSENHTFLIVDESGQKTVLRVHRHGYHSEQVIYSELSWMSALRRDSGMQTPRPVCGINGKFVQHIKLAKEEIRFAVLFAFEQGIEPVETEDLSSSFIQLGQLAAKCHTHAQNWSVPTDFERLVWDAKGILNPQAHWGDWRQAPNVTGTFRQTLDRAERLVHQRLGEYGSARDRFGIIHADMRLANLLIDQGNVKLIDFDDCGFGWFGYDFAAAVSFFEGEKQVPELFASWLKGYQQQRVFSDQDIAMVDTMVMLRRFALLAWIGSHNETDLASGLAQNFAQGSAELADRYVRTGRLVH